MAWQPPELTLKWGPWEEPDSEEEARTVDHTTKAFEAKLITRRTAVEKVAAIFGIEKPGAYAKKLDEEAEEAASLEMAMHQLAGGGAAEGHTKQPPGGDGKPKPPKPPAADT